MPDEVKTEETKPLVVAKKAHRFQPGHPKYGGRKKGMPTKHNWDSRQACINAGFDPLVWLMHVAKFGMLPKTDKSPAVKVTEDERLKCARELMRYVYPTLSAQQITGKDGGPIATAHLDLTQLMQDPALVAAAQALSLAATKQNAENTAQLLPGELEDR